MNSAIDDTSVQPTRWGAFFEVAAYPLLWVWICIWIAAGLYEPDRLPVIKAVEGAGLFLFLFALELRYPLQQRWRMTWQTFIHRDLVMVAINGGAAVLLNYGLVLLAIGAAGQWQGVMTGQALWLQVVVGLFVFEALQYTVHRWMHLSRGPVTDFMWRSHAIHHLPQQLYLIMHAVFHPVNMVVIRIVVQLTPIWVLGFDPLAVFLYGTVIGLHGTISHLNFDLKMGWMNYLFVGPELHRYHHSASSHEAVNYGATLSLFDLVFDTFRYTPGLYPEALGLSEQDGYPGQTQPLRSILFPFVPGKREEAV